MGLVSTQTARSVARQIIFAAFDRARIKPTSRIGRIASLVDSGDFQPTRSLCQPGPGPTATQFLPQHSVVVAIANTHFAYPQRDGQVKLARVVN